tara:strand:- start:209 stop:667 length:459 start_codon:yes stop_codon:yes gene_type:complete
MKENYAEEILKKARARKISNHLLYEGELYPLEVARLIKDNSKAKLVDVRTRPELIFVGQIPGAIHLEWQFFPSGEINPGFFELLEQVIAKEDCIIFLCRSGHRSHEAATASKNRGFESVYNMLEGFEGNPDAHGHRGKVSGWKYAGLPWHQS